MRKIKYIPALLSIIVLSACDSVSMAVKEPVFASKGKSIDQDTFRSGITQAYNENEFFQANLNLNSLVLQYKETNVEKQNRAKNKKIYYSDESTTITEGVLKYDSQDLLIDYEYNKREKREVESDETDLDKFSKINEHYFYELGSGDYENKILRIDLKCKSFNVGDTVTTEAAKAFMDYSIAELFTTYFNGSKMMHFAESGETHLYKFYRNSNMFTVTYKETYETSEQGYVNDHTVDVKKYYVTRETKSQVDLTEGAEAIRVSDKTDTACEILQDHDGYKKGEIIDVQSTRYVVLTAARKNVELNRITDYTSYTLN